MMESLSFSRLYGTQVEAETYSWHEWWVAKGSVCRSSSAADEMATKLRAHPFIYGDRLIFPSLMLSLETYFTIKTEVFPETHIHTHKQTKNMKMWKSQTHRGCENFMMSWCKYVIEEKGRLWVVSKTRKEQSFEKYYNQRECYTLEYFSTLNIIRWRILPLSNFLSNWNWNKPLLFTLR